MLVSPKRVTLVFVLSDVTTFLIQVRKFSLVLEGKEKDLTVVHLFDRPLVVAYLLPHILTSAKQRPAQGCVEPSIQTAR